MRYTGSCHCGKVEFFLEAPDDIECHECNCSICRLTGYLHLIVPRSSVTFTRGRDAVTTYRFNSGVAEHYFCPTCGIKPYYVPRSNPDGYSINVRCLSPQPKRLTVVPFDGQNWERHAGELRHLSK
jgi:hypothetical protein